MKNFQQNLLILLALALCALCAFQWYSQSLQRVQFNQLNDLANQQRAAIQDDTNQINDLQHQVSQMDASISSLRETIKTNEDAMFSQRREINRLSAENTALTNQIVEYQQTMDKLQAKLKEAYDGISKQNDAIKELTNQRDDIVKKYNDEVTDRNSIVAKYNDLAARFEKLQSGAKP